MQIVIKIDENLYTRLFDNGENYVMDMRRACMAIRKGKPLPKEHGRLIDADEVLKALIDADEMLKAIDTWDKFDYTETECFVREPGNDYVPYAHYEDMVKAVSGMPTIIEADKAESEDRE